MSPNPDGKGRIGVLDDIAASAPTALCPIDDPLRLMLGTTIVLSAEMKFCPIKGKRYHLYERGRLYMAMSAPDEITGDFGTYIGSCVQRDDCLWEVDIAQLPSMHLPAMGGVLRGRWYDRRFGYYNRLLAYHVVTKTAKLLPEGWSKNLLGSGLERLAAAEDPPKE